MKQSDEQSANNLRSSLDSKVIADTLRNISQEVGTQGQGQSSENNRNSSDIKDVLNSIRQEAREQYSASSQKTKGNCREIKIELQNIPENEKRLKSQKSVPMSRSFYKRHSPNLKNEMESHPYFVPVSNNQNYQSIKSKINKSYDKFIQQKAPSQFKRYLLLKNYKMTDAMKQPSEKSLMIQDQLKNIRKYENKNSKSVECRMETPEYFSQQENEDDYSQNQLINIVYNKVDESMYNSSNNDQDQLNVKKISVSKKAEPAFKDNDVIKIQRILGDLQKHYSQSSRAPNSIREMTYNQFYKTSSKEDQSKFKHYVLRMNSKIDLNQSQMFNYSSQSMKNFIQDRMNMSFQSNNNTHDMMKSQLDITNKFGFDTNCSMNQSFQSVSKLQKSKELMSRSKTMYKTNQNISQMGQKREQDNVWLTMTKTMELQNYLTFVPKEQKILYTQNSVKVPQVKVKNQLQSLPKIINKHQFTQKSVIENNMLKTSGIFNQNDIRNEISAIEIDNRGWMPHMTQQVFIQPKNTENQQIIKSKSSKRPVKQNKKQINTSQRVKQLQEKNENFFKSLSTKFVTLNGSQASHIISQGECETPKQKKDKTMLKPIKQNLYFNSSQSFVTSNAEKTLRDSTREDRLSSSNRENLNPKQIGETFHQNEEEDDITHKLKIATEDPSLRETQTIFMKQRSSQGESIIDENINQEQKKDSDLSKQPSKYDLNDQESKVVSALGCIQKHQLDNKKDSLETLVHNASSQILNRQETENFTSVLNTADHVYSNQIKVENKKYFENQIDLKNQDMDESNQNNEIPEIQTDIPNMIEEYKINKYDGVFKNVLGENPRRIYGSYQNKRSMMQKQQRNKQSIVFDRKIESELRNSSNEHSSFSLKNSILLSDQLIKSNSKISNKVLDDIQKRIKQQQEGPGYDRMNPKNEKNIYFKQLQELNNNNKQQFDSFIKEMHQQQIMQSDGEDEIKEDQNSKVVNVTEVKINDNITQPTTLNRDRGETLMLNEEYDRIQQFGLPSSQILHYNFEKTEQHTAKIPSTDRSFNNPNGEDSLLRTLTNLNSINASTRKKNTSGTAVRTILASNGDSTPGQKRLFTNNVPISPNKIMINYRNNNTNNQNNQNQPQQPKNNQHKQVLHMNITQADQIEEQVKNTIKGIRNKTSIEKQWRDNQIENDGFTISGKQINNCNSNQKNVKNVRNSLILNEMIKYENKKMSTSGVTSMNKDLRGDQSSKGGFTEQLKQFENYRIHNFFQDLYSTDKDGNAIVENLLAEDKGISFGFEPPLNIAEGDHQLDGGLPSSKQSLVADEKGKPANGIVENNRVPDNIDTEQDAHKSQISGSGQLSVEAPFRAMRIDINNKMLTSEPQFYQSYRPVEHETMEAFKIRQLVPPRQGDRRVLHAIPAVGKEGLKVQNVDLSIVQLAEDPQGESQIESQHDSSIQVLQSQQEAHTSSRRDEQPEERLLLCAGESGLRIGSATGQNEAAGSGAITGGQSGLIRIELDSKKKYVTALLSRDECYSSIPNSSIMRAKGLSRVPVSNQYTPALRDNQSLQDEKKLSLEQGQVLMVQSKSLNSRTSSKQKIGPQQIGAAGGNQPVAQDDGTGILKDHHIIVQPHLITGKFPHLIDSKNKPGPNKKPLNQQIIIHQSNFPELDYSLMVRNSKEKNSPDIGKGSRSPDISIILNEPQIVQNKDLLESKGNDKNASKTQTKIEAMVNGGANQSNANDYNPSPIPKDDQILTLNNFYTNTGNQSCGAFAQERSVSDLNPLLVNGVNLQSQSTQKRQSAESEALKPGNKSETHQYRAIKPQTFKNPEYSAYHDVSAQQRRQGQGAAHQIDHTSNELTEVISRQTSKQSEQGNRTKLTFKSNQKN